MMVMNPKPLVSVIVANWNGARDLEICLPTLHAQSYRPLEIIVVDSGSTDDSFAVASSSDVRWVGLTRNLGLAAALNRGAAASHGEFVLFLNNDMRFPEVFVESMVCSISGDPSIFSVDAIQYDWNGSKTVHLATSLAQKRSGDLDEQFVPGLFVCQRTYDAPTPVLMSSAANMLTRKSMFQELGGFDERLPVGYEDVELCWRAWLRGWKSMFDPGAICWHRVGQSSRSVEGSRVRFRGTLGGRLLTATKLLPVSYAIITWLVTLAGLASDVSRLRWQRVEDRLKVLSHFIGHLGPLLRERSEIYSSGRASPSQHLNRLLQLPGA